MILLLQFDLQRFDRSRFSSENIVDESMVGKFFSVVECECVQPFAVLNESCHDCHGDFCGRSVDGFGNHRVATVSLDHGDED